MDAEEYYRHQGDQFCPDNVGKNWISYWSKGKVDPKVNVECAGRTKHQETKTLNFNILNYAQGRDSSV